MKHGSHVIIAEPKGRAMALPLGFYAMAFEISNVNRKRFFTKDEV